MPNAFYRKLNDNSWLQQAGASGGPLIFRVNFNVSDGNWYAYYTSNGESWIVFPSPFGTAAAAQTALDNYMEQVNGGTA